jgi:hypothetical protein
VSLSNKIYISLTGTSTKFVGEINFSKDKDDLMGTGDAKLVYSKATWNDWIPLGPKVKIYGGVFDSGLLFQGRPGQISQDGQYIESKLEDLGWKAKRPFDGDYEGDISDVLKKLIKKMGLTPILKGIKKEKISRNEIWSSDSMTAAAGTGVCGSGHSSCKFCSGKVKWSTVYTTCVENVCPNCGKTGTIKFFKAKNSTDFQGPCGRLEYSGHQSGDAKRGKYAITDGMFLCCSCDIDFCVVCGHSHNQKKVINILSGGIKNKKKEDTSTEETTTETEEADIESESSIPEEPVTFEEELKKICDPRDYHVTINQKGECIVQSSNMPGSASFKVKTWMMEAESYTEEISEANIPTVAKVKYDKGTAVAYYKPLYSVYGAINPIIESQPKMHREKAERRAQSLLNKMLRDKKVKINFTMLATHKIYPGAWIEVPNPITGVKNILFVQSVNLRLSPKEVFTMNVECRFGPATPTYDDSEFSEVKGSITSIVEAVKRYDYKDKGCTTASCVIKTGSGDCWGMSDLIFTKCKAAGIHARIMQYPTTYSTRHRSVQYKSAGKWVNFPYAKLDKMFTATSGVAKGKVIKQC